MDNTSTKVTTNEFLDFKLLKNKFYTIQSFLSISKLSSYNFKEDSKRDAFIRAIVDEYATTSLYYYNLLNYLHKKYKIQVGITFDIDTNLNIIYNEDKNCSCDSCLRR